jgi:hypothetical protein
MGFGLAYGITSSMTAEATVHPDFSQVESDAFQVEVNQRYPIFFQEKRPFFMEARSLFNIAGGGDNMYTAVHSRKIVDPAWSAKLTGASGKLSYGALLAEDTVNDAAADSTGYGRNPRFAIARGKYTLNGDNYLGGIYAGHMVGSTYNHVVGADGVYIPGEHQRVLFSVLGSLSRRGVTEEERRGGAATLS